VELANFLSKVEGIYISSISSVENFLRSSDITSITSHLIQSSPVLDKASPRTHQHPSSGRDSIGRRPSMVSILYQSNEGTLPTSDVHFSFCRAANHTVSAFPNETGDSTLTAVSVNVATDGAGIKADQQILD
jgi:hypothetical protein